MSFKVSKSEKELINLSFNWMNSKNTEDKECGKYLLDQIILKYINDMYKENFYTSTLMETLEERITYDNSYMSLCHLNLLRICENFKKEGR